MNPNRTVKHPFRANTHDERLLAAHVEAAAFFAHRLHSHVGTGPRDYLARRGLGSIVDSPLWEVGYAPASWTELTAHLRRVGFSDPEICASGLGVGTRRNTVVDRFRDRITFGVRDHGGRVIAFVGRAAPGASGVPKYLNSPRSALYDKSAVLFGLGDQHSLLDSGGVPILVEGPLDVIAVSLASADHTPPLVGLAPCGTALTATHVRSLTESTTTPILVAFDADLAGASAAVRTYATLANASSITAARAVRLPPGADPASVLADSGPTGLRAALAETTPLADLVLDEVMMRYADRLDNAEARLCALRAVAPTVAALPQHEVARQAARLASLLDLGHPTVARELAEGAGPARLRPQRDRGSGYPQASGSAGRPHLSSRELEAPRAVGVRI